MSAPEIAAQLVGLIKELAPGAEGLASVSLGRMNQTRFAANEITTSGDVELSRVSVTIAKGKRHATATSTRSEPDGLRALVKRASEMASLAPEDPEWMGVLGPQSIKPASGTFDNASLSLTPEARASAAKTVIAAAEAKGVTAAGFVMAVGHQSALASTSGLVLQHPSTRVSLSVTARSTDGTGSGWAAAERVAASEIDPAAVANAAVDKALKTVKPGRGKAKTWTVVLEPACVADLLGFFLDALDTRSADEGRSFFSKKGGSTRVGEKLFAKGLSLKGDPFDPATPSAPYDDEGLPVEPTTYVEDGTLKALVTSRFWAQKTGKKPSAYPTALHLSGGAAKSIDELIGQVDRGLLVTRFWYTRWLDPQSMSITGLTRDGVLLIENGKIKGPVNNFRFNESPANVFAKAKAWTKDTVRVSADGLVLRVPALLADDFHMASVSAAV